MSPTNTPKKPSKGLLKTFKAAVKKIGRRTPGDSNAILLKDYAHCFIGASPAIADEIDVATVLDASGKRHLDHFLRRPN